MKTYKLHNIQKLPISVEVAWDFLTNPRNLKLITPDYMGFDIISGAENNIHTGQTIVYTVTPVLGIKTKWVSEITTVKEMEYFVDEQREGPYAMWRHEHFLIKIPGGTAMEDMVSYQLPLGKLGEMVHPILVKPKLEEIFIYRKEKLNEIFGMY